MRKVVLCALMGVLGLAAACGGGGGGTGASGTGGGTGGSTNGGCTDGLKAATGSDYCASIATTPNCSLVTAQYKSQVCGVPVLDPGVELSRSANVKEYAGSGPPDLSCFEPAGYPQKGTPQNVKMTGLVKIFSHGCESKNVTIEVYDAAQVYDGGGTLPAMIGASVVTSANCQADGVQADYNGTDCAARYECTYEYAGVPTETELVVLTKGDLWAPLYDFNVFIPNSQVQAGAWTHDVRALAADDYTVIPQAAIGTTITMGNGAIAGEVHDCGDVRLIGATVNVDVQKKMLTYFTDNQDNPMPDLTATATTALGLYSALDVLPGKASVAALGLVGGEVKAVGYQRIVVFPNAVTAVTFRGARSYQISQ
jgi:hypothetical protein